MTDPKRCDLPVYFYTIDRPGAGGFTVHPDNAGLNTATTEARKAREKQETTE